MPTAKEDMTGRFACPACASRPKLKQTPEGLYCAACERIYPITDGIPTLIVEEAILPATASSN